MKFNWTANDPSQKRKAALIPLLVLGLGWVLFFNEDDSKYPAPASIPAKRPAQPLAEKNEITPRTNEWSELPLEAVLAFNPFPIPKAIPKPKTFVSREAETLRGIANRKRADAEKRARAWQAQTVSIVYRGPEGPLAMIGTKTVAVGDMLDAETQVVDIRNDGVWVSKPAKEGSVASQPETPLSSPSSQGFMPQLRNLGRKFGF